MLSYISSHSVWVYPLKTKDQVFDKFKEWKAQVENFSGHNLKTLQTDNDGEFTSHKLRSYLKSSGVRPELTIPKTPELNGIAKRLNHTLSRSMLLDVKLSQKFWAEAVSTAAYLKNKIPTSTLKVIPHEAWYGHKPRVDYFESNNWEHCICSHSQGYQEARLKHKEFHSAWV